MERLPSGEASKGGCVITKRTLDQFSSNSGFNAPVMIAGLGGVKCNGKLPAGSGNMKLLHLSIQLKWFNLDNLQSKQLLIFSSFFFLPF